MLIPVQAEYYALEGLSQLVHSINLVKARLNPRLAVGGVLLTMVDGRTRLSADVEAEVRKHFGELVFTTDGAALRASCGSAEPRFARNRVRPPFARRGRLLEGGDGACRARLNARGLGRGLEVLLGGATATELAELPVDAIHPNPRQPRRRFDSEAGAGLADSVRAQGVVQPVLVRPRRPAATS